MGLTVLEMLNHDFFKDFKVLAGHGGLDNQIQGLTILDAPDGYKWTKGREFVITSGYIFKSCADSLEDFLNSEYFKHISALGLKFDRYSIKMPQELLKIFDENKIPLIYIPTIHPWMEIYNAINVIVMNKTIRQFNIGKIRPMNFSNLTFHARKINAILNAMEYDMKFPSMLYDITNEKVYYSSSMFKEMSKDFRIDDFWNPSFNFSKEVLCDNLKMARYRFYDDKYDKPYSWITIPIVVSDKIRAYFVLMEATGLIDYFDQFAIRLGFMQLQAIYEQILVAQSLGDVGFASFIKKVISGSIRGKENIIEKSLEINIDINCKHYMFVLEQLNHEITLSGYNDTIIANIRKSFNYNEYRHAFVEDNKCLLLFKIDEGLSHNHELDSLHKKVTNFIKRNELDIENVQLSVGFSDVPEYIFEVERSYGRCLKALKIGRYLYPNTNIWMYSQLGAFAWMDIKDDEFELMMKDVKNLYHHNESKELIETLRTYIECNMNYSLTAEKMFLHINTVRKRIEKISDMIDADLNDSISRLKIELILKLFTVTPSQ
ncbi:MAG: PucR family transcriptional regulator [Sedimentibacter sp.]